MYDSNLISYSVTLDNLAIIAMQSLVRCGGNESYIAERAYKIASCMLKARNNHKGGI